MNESPFTPGPTVQLAVTGTTGSVALGTGGGTPEEQKALDFLMRVERALDGTF